MMTNSIRDTITISIHLPSDLVRDAEEFDLLHSDKIEALLRQKLEHLVNDAVNTEIKIYRAEKSKQQNEHE